MDTLTAIVTSAAPRSRIVRSFLTAACVGVVGACSPQPGPATGGSGGGASAKGGSGGAISGSGGAPSSSGGNAGTGGAPASGGRNGSGGAPSGASGGTSGGHAGSGGSAVDGSGGAPGTGGANTATGGMSGGGLAPAPSPCVGSSFPTPTLSGLTPTRVAGVPPLDGFNSNGSAAFTIIEGPVWAGDNLYVSEISYLTQAEAMQGTVPPPSRILRVTAAGQVSVAVPDAGTNGLAVDAAGSLLGCDHKNGAITRFMMPGFTPSPIVSGYQNMRFDSPNDLVLGPDGTLYFSDPDYQAARMRPQTATRLYRLPSGATEAVVVDEMRRQPNGVSLSPKGDVLYASSQDGVYQYPISGGTVGAGTRLSQSPASGDGMAVDCAGNLYVASGNAIVVLSPAGTQLGQIMVSGVQSVTNAAFGGSDRKTLYITALGSLSTTGGMGGPGPGGGGFGGAGGGGNNNAMPGLFKVTLNVPGYPY